MTDLQSKLSAESRTRQLWLQYMQYVRIVKQFLLTERTCNWHLHLKSVHDMLNLFAATGHNNYAKSARLYLQTMKNLPPTLPQLYAMFNEFGLHAIRHSDRYWAGLSSDLIIEQTMMKAIKGRGGLTRGRRMQKNVQLFLVVHQTVIITSTPSRAARDCSDLQQLIDWLDVNDPILTNDSCLRSLSTGLAATAKDNITCDQAEVIGFKIHHNMDGKNFSNCHSKNLNKYER